MTVTCVILYNMKDRNYAKISPEDIRKLYRQMQKENTLSKYTFPTKPSSDGYYHVWVKDEKGGRKQLKSKSLEDLQEKVFQISFSVTSFRSLFEDVQKQKLLYIKDPEKLLSAQNTIERNRRVYTRFIANTEFEKLDISEISKRDIENLCLNILREHDLRKKEFMNLRTLLNSVFKYAYEEYLIIDNPYTRINFDKYTDMLLRPASIENRAHTNEEVQAILQEIYAKQHKSPLYMPAYALELQIAMGLRRGEIPPLCWSDVKDGYIWIHRELISVKRKESVEYTIVSHTKTYKDRRFPITMDIQNILDKLRRLDIDSPYLFPGKTEIGCINNNVVGDYYSRICNKLRIKRSRDFIKGPHSFRRNAITSTVNNGGDIFMASQLFGNTPNVAEQNYYTGLNMSVARNILEGNQK